MPPPGNIGHSGFSFGNRGQRTPFGRPQDGGIRPGGGNAGFQMRPPPQQMQRPMMPGQTSPINAGFRQQPPPQMGGGMPQGGGWASPQRIQEIMQQRTGGAPQFGGKPMPTPEQFQQQMQGLPQRGMFGGIGGMIQKQMPQIMERYKQMQGGGQPPMQTPPFASDRSGFGGGLGPSNGSFQQMMQQMMQQRGQPPQPQAGDMVDNGWGGMKRYNPNFTGIA